MSEYDDQVAVRATAPGRYAAELAGGWVVGGGVNGGFQLGVVGSALRAALPDKPDPIAVSAHFLSAGVPGPAEVSVDVRREGGSVATAAVELTQGGQTRISALATCSSLARFAARGGPSFAFAAPPDVAPVDECVSSLSVPPEVRAFIPMLDRFDLRLDPRNAAWHEGEPSHTGRIAGWFRFADGREPDLLSLLTVCDVLPPVTFDLGMPGWAPTLELTVHLRAEPAPGWLRLSHSTRVAAEGVFDEECEVWDSEDRLVAQSRQLALVPRPA